MKITKEIEVTVKVVLEIETDQVEYGVHGGEEEPGDIADAAVSSWVDSMEEEMVPEVTPINGVKAVRTHVINYNQI